MNKAINLIVGPACLAIALAASADTGQLRSLAASCSVCHGSKGVAAPGLPSLAGQPRDELLQKMRDFKADSKPGTLMPQLSKGYTDAQLAQLADYFSSLKP